MSYCSDRPPAPTGEPVSSADSGGPDIETILAEVLVRTDPSQRASYLDQACAVHPEVRQQVEQWAQLIEETVDSLESPAAGLDADFDDRAVRASQRRRARGTPGRDPDFNPGSTRQHMGTNQTALQGQGRERRGRSDAKKPSARI